MKRRIDGEFITQQQQGLADRMVSRKDSPKRGSISHDQILCGPCRYNADNKKATVFCNSCCEHLCYTCEKSHQGLKLTRHHGLVIIKDMSPSVKREPYEEDSIKRVSNNTVTWTDVLENVPGSRNQRQCDSCCKGHAQPNRATTHCAPCNKYLCHDCQMSHHGTKVDFSVIPYDEIESSSLNEQDSMPEYCKKHNFEIVKYYCEDHKRLICLICQDLGHQNCQKTELQITSGNHQYQNTAEQRKRPLARDKQTLLSSSRNNIHYTTRKYMFYPFLVLGYD